MTIKKKTTEQYFPVELFTILYKVVLAFWVYEWHSQVYSY